MENKHTIRFAIPTNPDYWGNEEATEYVEQITNRIAEILKRDAPNQFPNTKIIIDFVPETISFGNKPWVEIGEWRVHEEDLPGAGFEKEPDQLYYQMADFYEYACNKAQESF